MNNVNYPIRVEKFHYLPWSYAANLFGLVAIFAGASGIISYYRRSYSTLFVYMSLSLLTTLFGGYLIAYYSILINFYMTYSWNVGSNRSQTMDTSWALMATNLALSCSIVLFGIVGFLLGVCGIKAGTTKGLHLEDQYTAFAEKPGPKGTTIFHQLTFLSNNFTNFIFFRSYCCY